MNDLQAIRGLFDLILDAEGAKRQALADDNKHVLESELARDMALKGVELRQRRVRRLELALAEVRRLQEAAFDAEGQS